MANGIHKPIPFWALADDTPYPCPCGRPLDEAMIVYKGEKGLLRLFHTECVQNYIDMDDLEEGYEA